jgi:hypothetical protein
MGRADAQGAAAYPPLSLRRTRFTRESGCRRSPLGASRKRASFGSHSCFPTFRWAPYETRVRKHDALGMGLAGTSVHLNRTIRLALSSLLRVQPCSRQRGSSTDGEEVTIVPFRRQTRQGTSCAHASLHPDDTRRKKLYGHPAYPAG